MADDAFWRLRALYRIPAVRSCVGKCEVIFFGFLNIYANFFFQILICILCIHQKIGFEQKESITAEARGGDAPEDQTANSLLLSGVIKRKN